MRTALQSPLCRSIPKYSGNLPASLFIAFVGMILISWTGFSQVSADEAESEKKMDRADLVYRAEVLPGAVPTIRIALEFQGDPSGHTVLSICERNQWNGIANCSEGVKSVVSISGDGTETPLPADENGHWFWDHAPDARLRIRYELVSDGSAPTTDYSSFSKPVIQEDWLHLYGNTGIMVPSHFTGKDAVYTIEWQWMPFPTPDWRFLATRGNGQRLFRYTGTLAAFRKQSILAGKLEVRRIRKGALSLTVATVRDDRPFSIDELAEKTVALLTVARKLFAEKEARSGFLFLLPARKSHSRALAANASSVGNGLVVFCDPHHPLNDRNASGKALLPLLAHEIVHFWNGGRLHFGHEDEAVKWFSEGFTDYYARRLLSLGKMMSCDAALARRNAVWRQYWQSPVRDRSNEVIRTGFWSHSALHTLPYLRGDLAAQILDIAIRRKNKGKRSLDSLLAKMLHAAKTDKKALDNERIFGFIEDAADSLTARNLRIFIRDGGLPDAFANALAPCYELVFRSGGDEQIQNTAPPSTGIPRFRTKKSAPAWCRDAM